MASKRGEMIAWDEDYYTKSRQIMGSWGAGNEDVHIRFTRQHNEIARLRQAILRDRLLMAASFALGFGLAWLLR